MRTFWSVLLSLACCFFPLEAHAQPAKLNVVATNSIVGDWVNEVAGEEVNLTVLVGPNSDVHSFEPTPMDNINISKAEVIVELGFGLEHWMNKIYKSSGSHARRVVLTKAIAQPLTINRDHQQDIDPHVWHNVRYAMDMVKYLRDGLKAADPNHAQAFESNAAVYLRKLQDLDQWVMRATSQIPKGQRKLITNHDSLGYFCERYQFKLAGSLFDSFTTEAEDPSAKGMARLVFEIKKEGVPAVFAENVQNSKVLAAMASEAHVKLAPPLFTDALSGKNGPAPTYIDMIRYNVQTIVNALTVKE